MERSLSSSSAESDQEDAQHDGFADLVSDDEDMFYNHTDKQSNKKRKRAEARGYDYGVAASFCQTYESQWF
jgi:hypothetical protein